MCFLGLTTLRVVTLILAAILAICNVVDMSIAIKNLSEICRKFQPYLCASLALDCFINLAICAGVYGAFRSISRNMRLYVFSLMGFFIGKILIAKSIEEADEKVVDLILNPWYEFDVVLCGLSMMVATPFLLKLVEKENGF